MKKTMIQFHATLDELVKYIHYVNSEFDLVVTMMSLRPFTLQKIEGELSVGSSIPDGDVRIIFTTEKPNFDASSPNNFYDLNPGSVGLHIGRLVGDSLGESALAFMSDDKEKIAVANKLAARLKKITRAGAIAVNPVNGAESNAHAHRYTEGAKSMYDQGVKMQPVAGNSLYKLLN